MMDILCYPWIRNATLRNSCITNVEHLHRVSTLPWQRGMAEMICLNVFIYTPKHFISHCEKCNQRLPALIIIHLNLSGTALVSTFPPEPLESSMFPHFSSRVKFLLYGLSRCTHKAQGEEVLQPCCDEEVCVGATSLL